MPEQFTPNHLLPYYQGPDPANGAVQQQALAERLDTVLAPVPIGAMVMWPTGSPPAGWLLCNGAAIPAPYTTLITLIGPNTPNLQGRIPVGSGTAAGDATATAKTLLTNGGSEKVTLTGAQMPSHNHGGATGSHTHALGGGLLSVIGDTGVFTGYGITAGDRGVTNGTILDAQASISPDGGGAAHENMPPYFVVNYIIRAQ